MQTKIVLILSYLIVFSLISCENDKKEETINNNGTSNVQIDGEAQNTTGGSGILDNKFHFNNNEQFAEGLELITSIALKDNTGIFITFNNNDLSAENVTLGDYTAIIDEAFSASEFKYAQVTLSGSNGYFSSLGTATDKIKLLKCDKIGKKISGEFDAIVTNKENDETIHVKGSFIDLSFIDQL